jgi:hypothetical protein
MRKYTLIFMILIVIFGCKSNPEQVRPTNSILSSNTDKNLSMLNNTFRETNPEDWSSGNFIRYHQMIIIPMELFHRVYGRVPNSIDEFFMSDVCLVHPKEITSGLLFTQGDTLDYNHPESIVYKVTDKDTAELSMILHTTDGSPYIYMYKWDKEKFLWYIPRADDGSSDQVIAEALKKDLPKGKKGKAMIDHFKAIMSLAIAEYYDIHNDFPTDVSSLFEENWGQFRFEPWKNYEYDDPVNQLPTYSVGFDKTRKAYYVKEIWADKAVDEFAIQLPSNHLDEPGRPVNIQYIKDIKSLNIDLFMDVETLRKQAQENLAKIKPQASEVSGEINAGR